MEQEDTIVSLLKKNRIAIIIGVVVVGLILVISGIVVKNINSPVKTSNNDSTLSNQLETEKGEIADAFNDRFEFLSDRYKIDRIVLVGAGDYATMLLETDSVSYRSILRKEDDGWIVVGVPSVVLYYDDFLEIPKEVVRVANDLGAENE